jgi:glycerate kinase
VTDRERPVLVAPDSFKGTMRASEVAGAIGRGLERAGLMPPDLCPVADGGEGTLDALLPGLGGEVVAADVHDPLGRPLRAAFGLVEGGGTAIVEMAAASGLNLVAEYERDAWAASTYGTGELIAAAVDAGAQVVLVAVGGSATTDGGAGALEAIAEAGGLRGARLVVLCDVRVPFERAPGVFGPQKGADPEMVIRLEERLDALAATWPRDPRGVPMTGGAGGLSGGLWAALDAAIEPGAPWVLDALWSPARGSSTSRRWRASSWARSARAPGRPACPCTRWSAATRSTRSASASSTSSGSTRRATSRRSKRPVRRLATSCCRAAPRLTRCRRGPTSPPRRAPSRCCSTSTAC